MWLRGKESDEPSGWVAVQVTFKYFKNVSKYFFRKLKNQIVAENQRYKLDPEFEAKVTCEPGAKVFKPESEILSPVLILS